MDRRAELVTVVDPAMTLGEAADRLRGLVDHGHECPCCTQFAKVYRRKIHATMARELIQFYRVAGRDWGHLPSILGYNGGDVTKCRYWGLIVEDDAIRDDGSSGAGWWQGTPAGHLWVRGRLAVPKFARIYDGRCLGLEGALVTIRDALGDRFDYGDLMG